MSPPPVLVTLQQRHALRDLLVQRGKKTPQDALRFLGVVVGREIRSTAELTVDEYEAARRALGAEAEGQQGGLF